MNIIEPIPTKFCSKPVIIEAICYSQETREAIIKWSGARHIGMDEAGAEYELANLIIHTLEGDMRVNLGDWVVKGLKGEFYPVKPDIFVMKYEPLSKRKFGFDKAIGESLQVSVEDIDPPPGFEPCIR